MTISIKIERRHFLILLSLLLIIAGSIVSSIISAQSANDPFAYIQGHLLSQIYTKIGDDYYQINTSSGKMNSSFIEIVDTLNLNGHKITNAGEIMSLGSIYANTNQKVATEYWATTQFVDIMGDTMQGNLNMGGYNITNAGKLETYELCIGAECKKDWGSVSGGIGDNLADDGSTVTGANDGQRAVDRDLNSYAWIDCWRCWGDCTICSKYGGIECNPGGCVATGSSLCGLHSMSRNIDIDLGESVSLALVYARASFTARWAAGSDATADAYIELYASNNKESWTLLAQQYKHGTYTFSISAELTSFASNFRYLRVRYWFHSDEEYYTDNIRLYEVAVWPLTL